MEMMVARKSVELYSILIWTEAYTAFLKCKTANKNKNKLY